MDGIRYVVYDRFDVYESDLSGVGGDVDLVVNGVSTAQVVLADDHRSLPGILVPGARCGVIFRGAERFRGMVRATPGQGPRGGTTVRVESDHRKLWDWLGWPDPTSPVDEQSVEYAVYTGQTETVVKTALADAFARLGVPWTVAPDLGRGIPARAEMRFHPLAEKLIPLLDAAGLVLTLAYTPSGVVVDVREPDTVAGKLTIGTGIVGPFTYTRTAPTVTRAIVGGRGEGIAREFAEVVDAPREAAWGDIIERFVDARNTDESTDLTEEGAEEIEDGAASAGVAAELIETDRLMYGHTYIEGDFIDLQLGPIDQVEQIRTVSITGFRNTAKVVPSLGTADEDDDPDSELEAAVALLAQGVRDERRR